MMRLTRNLFEVCLSKYNKAMFDSRVWLIVDLRYVFNCRNPEKDLSAEHDVAGIVASIFAALESGKSFI